MSLWWALLVFSGSSMHVPRCYDRSQRCCAFSSEINARLFTKIDGVRC